MATSVGWIVEHAVLMPLGLEIPALLTFIMVIASLVQLTGIVYRQTEP